MDRIEKAVAKLSSKEREWVRAILEQIGQKQTDNLDIKKLKGREDVFRARKGDIRIMYRIEKEKIFLLVIERRNDNTYK
ncbi:MAG: hypothetical protein Q8P07_02250 [bacterium]|nr:hypothetical protein [bacterium]